MSYTIKITENTPQSLSIVNMLRALDTIGAFGAKIYK